MVAERRLRIAAALRQRLLQGLESGALRDGDRLPSTREVAADLRADQRVVAEAYRALAAEGLVELRPRSGVFVAALPGGDGARPRGPSPAWLARVLAEGVRHGVPLPEIADAIAAVTRGRPLTATVVAGTVDQAEGIARELREDFGLEARGYLVDRFAPGEPLPRAVQRTHLLVGTELTGPQAAALARRLRRPHVVVDARPDLLSPEWGLLLRRLTYVVIADLRFAALLHRFLEAAPGAENVRVLVAGRDDLSRIPPDAPTYVTEAARQQIGRGRLPGRLVAAARVLSDAARVAVAEFIVTERRRAADERRA